MITPNILIINESDINNIPCDVEQENLAPTTRDCKPKQKTIYQEYIPEKIISKTKGKSKVNSKNKHILTSSELMSLQFDTLTFDSGWEQFLPQPTKIMNIGVFGSPKNGKTAGACQFAAYLTNFGKVLYNFADQGINKNTQDLWVLARLDNNPNAEASNFKTLEDLDAVCASGEYQYIFIDLINAYIDRTKIKPHEFEDRYLKKYPNISFILMFEVTKQGKFKGDQKWMHIVDQIVEVKDYLMETRGRYGSGHYIVWKEEFKKLNPKKYAELISPEETEEQNILYL